MRDWENNDGSSYQNKSELKSVIQIQPVCVSKKNIINVFFRNGKKRLEFFNSLPTQLTTLMYRKSIEKDVDTFNSSIFCYTKELADKYSIIVINKYLLAFLSIDNKLPPLECFELGNQKKDKFNPAELAEKIRQDKTLALLELWYNETKSDNAAFEIAQYYQNELHNLDKAVECYQLVSEESKYFNQANYTCAEIISGQLQLAQDKLILLSEDEVKNYKKMYFMCLINSGQLMEQRTKDLIFNQMCGQSFPKMIIENVNKDYETLINMAKQFKQMQQQLDQQKEKIRQQEFSLETCRKHINHLEKELKKRREHSIENLNERTMSGLNYV